VPGVDSVAPSFQINRPRRKVEAKHGAADDPAIATITEFLESPDQVNDWPQWIGAITDQLFIYDAVSIAPRLTRGGGLYALEQIDGATITPLVDAWGRRPTDPDPAFKQILKSQYHAALAMLRNAVAKCPDELWYDATPTNAFWQVAYHTMFFAHFYLQPNEAAFRPWQEHRSPELSRSETR